VDIADIFEPVIQDVERLVDMQINDAAMAGHSAKVLFTGKKSVQASLTVPGCPLGRGLRIEHVSL
jgi:hypothetical protein